MPLAGQGNCSSKDRLGRTRDDAYGQANFRPLTRVMLMEYWPPPIGQGWPTATLAKHTAPAGGNVALGAVVGALVVVGVGVSLGVVVGGRVVVGVGGGVAGAGGGGGVAALAWYHGVSPTVLCSQATLAHIICDAQSRPSACAACGAHHLTTWRLPPGHTCSVSASVLHQVLCACRLADT